MNKHFERHLKPYLTIDTDTPTFWVTLFVGILVSVALFFANPLMFPFEEYHLVNIALLLWLPLMAIILFLRPMPESFGMSAGNRREGLKWVLIGYLIMLPFVIISAKNPAFRDYYIQRLKQPMGISNWLPIAHNGQVSPIALAYYEIIMGLYFFCWEFFFRGFMLFGLARGKYVGIIGAIILQTIPFTLLHWSLTPGASKPIAEILGAALGGPLLGYLAIRTRSFYYGYLIHWLMAGTLDVLVVISSWTGH